METESGAKIAIRGKGSVKEGKGRSDAAHTSNQEEDLHCLIMADTEEKVNKAKKLIHNVIETVSFLPEFSNNNTDLDQAASIPEGQNELKRNQLRELAALNGTLRDDENQACQNCGQIGHRKYDCPEQRNFTAGIICRVCGNAGHMAKDCPDRQRGTSYREGPGGPPGHAARIGTGDAVDREYEVSFVQAPFANYNTYYFNSNSCKNSLAVHPLTLLVASKLVLGPTNKLPLLVVMMSSHGSVVLLVLPLLGSVAEMIVAGMILEMLAQQEDLHPGLEIMGMGAEATTVETLTMEVTMAMELRLELHHGNRLPPILPLVPHLADILVTLHLDMAQATKEAWAHLLDLLHLLDSVAQD